jgi:hypothetical protein
MAENFAGFAARCPLTESLVMVIAGIGGKQSFAASAFSLMVFHKIHHRKPPYWQN